MAGPWAIFSYILVVRQACVAVLRQLGNRIASCLEIHERYWGEPAVHRGFLHSCPHRVNPIQKPAEFMYGCVNKHLTGVNASLFSSF
uniref:Secreted protein n=1 Tax=Anguilla anguilla TaxID=7936 RepID=A0A0E9UGS0_ANGAN